MLRQTAQTAPQTENLPYNPGADLPRSQWVISPENAAAIWANFDRPAAKNPQVETIFTLKNRTTRETQAYAIATDRPMTTRQLESAALLLTGERLSKFSLVSLESFPFEF